MVSHIVAAHSLRCLTLAVVLIEVCAIDDIDGTGLVGTDGDRSGIAIGTVGIAAHKVACIDETLIYKQSSGLSLSVGESAGLFFMYLLFMLPS